MRLSLLRTLVVKGLYAVFFGIIWVLPHVLEKPCVLLARRGAERKRRAAMIRNPAKIDADDIVASAIVFSYLFLIPLFFVAYLILLVSGVRLYEYVFCS